MADDGSVLIVDETKPLFQEQTLLSGDELESFRGYIKAEIEEARESESRSVLLESIKKWRRQALARPERAVKDEPFPKSTNLAPPLTQSKVNTIFGKTLAGFSLKRPFWDCITNDSALKAEAAAFGRLLNSYANDPFSMNFKPVLRKMLYRTVRDGFMFYEVAWANETVSVIDETGAMRETTVRSGPEVRTYRPEDVLTNQTWTDLQKAPWVALGFTMTWAEIMDQVAIGRFSAEAAEDMKPFRKADLSEAEADEQAVHGVDQDPSGSAEITASYDLWRFYAKWIIDGQAVDLVGVIHLGSGAILYVEPNRVGWRMVGKIGYFAIDDSLYDVGVGHQCELLQEEVEMLHNLGGDAMKWSMLGAFKAKKDAGIDTKTPIYPGRVIMVDDMNDFQEIRFQFDIGPVIAKEEIAMRYADMATGANQALSGQADSTLKSGGGAMAQQVLMQSASTILDAEFDTMDESFGELGRLLAILVIKNASFVPLESLVSPADAQILGAFFSAYTAADVVSKFRFVVRTTDIQRSETTKKETLALFSQLYSQYVQEVLGLMAQQIQIQAAPNPATAPISAFLAKAISGKTELMKQIADFMHVGDVGKYFTEEVPDDGSRTGTVPGAQGPMGPYGQAGAPAGQGLPAGPAGGPEGAGSMVPGAGPVGHGEGAY